MVHVGSNKLVNDWAKDVFVAYSAASPNGGADVWRVAKIAAGKVADSVDIDYIRAAAAGTSLRYDPIIKRNGFTAPAPTWVKLRQFANYWLRPQDDNANIGIIHHNSALTNPALALDEAAIYDKGRHLTGNKDTRGTAAVNAAIQEWEDKIKANQLETLARDKRFYEL